MKHSQTYQIYNKISKLLAVTVVSLPVPCLEGGGEVASSLCCYCDCVGSGLRFCPCCDCGWSTTSCEPDWSSDRATTCSPSGNGSARTIGVHGNDCENDDVPGRATFDDDRRPAGCCGPGRDHRCDVSVDWMAVRSAPSGHGAPCRQAYDRPWPLAHLRHHAYRRTFGK